MVSSLMGVANAGPVGRGMMLFVWCAGHLSRSLGGRGTGETRYLQEVKSQKLRVVPISAQSQPTID